MVDEVVRGYRLTGDLLPPLFPVVRGLRRLSGANQVIPAERTARILPGEQAQGVIVQRGLDLSPPFLSNRVSSGAIRAIATALGQ